MAEQASGHKPAEGWRRDPCGRHFGRYWSGEQWTDHVISAGRVPSIDPVGQVTLGPERNPASQPRTEPESDQDRVGRWEKDPFGRHSSRYWDGRRWTEHVMSAEKVPSIDPVPEPNSAPRRMEPSGSRVTPVVARTEVIRASPKPEPLGPPEARPLPPGGWEGFRLWTRHWWPLGVVVCGLIIAGVGVGGGSPRPTVGNDATTITLPVQTTAPSAAAQLAPTIPLTTQVPTTLPGTPAVTGAPSTAPGTAPGSQPPATSPQVVDPPTTTPQSGNPNQANATTTSGSSTRDESLNSITSG